MDKTAKPDHPIVDLLAKRWSPRAFSDRLVEPEKVRRLFEAARWAASSYNEQPWRFIIAAKDQPAEFERVLSCLTEANRAWAKGAPLIGLTLAKKTFSRNGKPNRVHIHDIGLAMGNLCVQATAMDLFVHQMAGIELAKIPALFEVPDDFEPATGFAIGYLGDPKTLPEAWMHESETAPRQRKPLREIVFGGKFGEPSSLL